MTRELDQTAESLKSAQPAEGRFARKVTRGRPKRPITSDVESGNSPALRLVGAGAPDMKPPVANPTPISGATDPRWVLAVRTAEMLEGDVLPPNKRESLMHSGKVMGLSPFDCSLILAIVQDRARRGLSPAQCPAASTSQLALIPLPQRRSPWSALADKPGQIALIAAGLLAFQALLMWIWLG